MTKMFINMKLVSEIVTSVVPGKKYTNVVHICLGSESVQDYLDYH